MNYNNIIKRQSFIIVVSILVMSAILIGTSYALFTQNNSSTTSQVITSGTLLIDYTGSDSTTLNSGEVTNEEPTNGFKIQITNTGSLPMQYNILLFTTLTNEVDHSLIKVQLDGGQVKTMSSLTKTPETADLTNKNQIVYVLGSSSIDAANPSNSDEKTHYVKVWLDTDDDSVSGQRMSVKAKVEGEVEES